MQQLMKVAPMFLLQMFSLSLYAKSNGRKQKLFLLLKFDIRGHFPSMLLLKEMLQCNVTLLGLVLFKRATLASVSSCVAWRCCSGRWQNIFV